MTRVPNRLKLRFRPSGRATSAGQSLVEYLVLTAAIALALGVAMADDTSVLRQMVEALRSAYGRFAFAVSLP